MDQIMSLAARRVRTAAIEASYRLADDPAVQHTLSNECSTTLAVAASALTEAAVEVASTLKNLGGAQSE